MLLPLGLWETVRKRVKVIRKLHILVTSNHRPNVQKAFRLVQTHKVPYRITGRAPRQTAQSLSWLQAALVWQSTRQFLMKKQGWERSACDGYHLATTKIWILVFHSCTASTCIGVLLWTSEKCRQCFSGLHCHARNLALNSYVRFRGRKVQSWIYARVQKWSTLQRVTYTTRVGEGIANTL